MAGKWGEWREASVNIRALSPFQHLPRKLGKVVIRAHGLSLLKFFGAEKESQVPKGENATSRSIIPPGVKAKKN